MSSFFSLSFKKCNKLDEYIYTYFFIISIILLKNFFYNKDFFFKEIKIFGVTKMQQTFIFLVLLKIKIS